MHFCDSSFMLHFLRFPKKKNLNKKTHAIVYCKKVKYLFTPFVLLYFMLATSWCETNRMELIFPQNKRRSIQRRFVHEGNRKKVSKDEMIICDDVCHKDSLAHKKTYAGNTSFFLPCRDIAVFYCQKKKKFFKLLSWGIEYK